MIIITLEIIIIIIKEIIMTLMNDLQERQLPECPAVPPEREGRVQVLSVLRDIIINIIKKPSFAISTIIIVIIQQDHQHPNLSSSTS